MSLMFPFPIFGRVFLNGVAVAGETVYAKDLSTPQGTVNVTTDASGAYFMDISTIATNGDNIKVWMWTGDVFGRTTFTLDISGPATEINLYAYNGGLPLVRNKVVEKHDTDKDIMIET